MARLTKEQVKERLQKLVGENMIAEGVNPSEAINNVLEIVDSYEVVENELTLANDNITTLTSQNETLKGDLTEAQKTNINLLKRVSVSDTIQLGGGSQNDEEDTTSIEDLLTEKE